MPTQAQAPTFTAPPVLSDMNFDDLLPPEPDFETESQSPAFSMPRGLSETAFDDRPQSSSAPGFPAQMPDPKPAPASEQQGPVFPKPPSMSEMSFDHPGGKPDAASRDVASSPAPDPAPSPIPGQRSDFGHAPVANASGMGISLTGPGVPHTPSGPTPAQVAATSQSLRIRLLRPDGKPFDGPEITTGPKESEAATDTKRSGFDTAQRGPKKQPPKPVVKTGPLERFGHVLAVLAISAIGIVPLAYLLLQSVHDREDKLAAKITVPTKMNVLDGTSDAYLAGMVVVLLLVAFVYWTRLKRRRER